MKLTLNDMKPSINNRLLDSLMRLGPVGRQSYLPWLNGARSYAAKKARDRTKITLAWANDRLRHRVIDLATEAGLQTAKLKSNPKVKIVVLQRADGHILGWAGMDVETAPEHPEVFSGFVYPEFRRLGLGALLEHVWWAYISAWGCKIAYMRMECAVNQRVLGAWLKTGYCRQVMDSGLSRRLIGACHMCELLDAECTGNSHLEVDVEKALAASIKRMGNLDICKLPIRFSIETPQHRPAYDLSATLELSTLPPEAQGH